MSDPLIDAPRALDGMEKRLTDVTVPTTSQNVYETSGIPLEAHKVGMEEPVDGDAGSSSEDDEKTVIGENRFRDLSGSEVHDFPGIKREHWWYV